MITLSITSLSRSFRAGTAGCSARVTVLRALDLALWPGEIVALEGARASGRSTLLACAAGLLRPDAGSILWLGARVPAPGELAFASARMSQRQDVRGALYAALEAAPFGRTRLVLVDDLPSVAAIERRMVFALLGRHALAGAAVLFAADEELAAAPLATRVVTLANGALVQRRKRSAARIAASSPASRARTSARSTYGRSLRSPQ